MNLEDVPGYRMTIGAKYDAEYAALSPADARARHAALAPYVARVVTALDLADEGYHLDLGTGDGLLALAVARARPKMTVVGFDAAPRALALARELAREEGLRNVAFAEGDAEAPPDGMFEGVSALSVFNLLPDKLAALAAWRKIALPGGRLVIADGFATGGPGSMGAGAASHDAFVLAARRAGWRLVRALDAKGAWPWREYLRDDTRFAITALTPV